ncbi:MAG: amidohydrolase family protein [Maribacter sp.]
MKNAVKFLLILCILIVTSCQPSGELFLDATCIENVNVIHPENGLIENQTVIIQGEKILKVISSKDIQLSAENKIIDGTGKYLMPGLWDAHIHFAYMEELAPSMFDLFLGYGITSVRDTGGKVDFVKMWKDKALANPENAPRVMMAGPLLDGIPNVYDGSTPQRPPLSVGLPTVDAAIKKVNELESLGVDLLKAYEMLTPEQFGVITKMAKEKGLKVTGHVPLSMDVISASNAGLSSMEHMRNLELSCASNSDELWQQRLQLLEAEKDSAGGVLRSKIHALQRETAVKNYDDEKANEVLAVLAKNETWQIPTLALGTFLSNRHFNNQDWKESITYLPEEIEQKWKENAESIEKMPITPFRKQYSDWSINMVKKIHETKIEIMAGTDCPIALLTPGQSLHEELVVLVKAGLTPLEAIKTATVNPAKYFNLENELGLVQEGMWADLILLDANPLKDISNTQSINAVVKNGKYFDKSELNAILKRARNPVK